MRATEHTGAGDTKTGNRTYHDRIPEGTGHIDITLTYRIIGGSGCGRDRGRTHTGFVREDTTGNAVSHCVGERCNDRTQNTTADCPEIKGRLQNQNHTGRNILDIQDDNDQTGNDIENSHQRHHNRRYLGNRLDTADNDQQRQNRNHDSDYCSRCTEGLMDGRRNRISLCHIADTEGGDHCKECEQPAEYTAEFLVLQGLFHGIHRTAGHFSLFIHFPVFDREHTFTEFGSQSEAGRDPHPDQGTRATGNHSGRDTDDITGTDRGSQCGCQCRERRDITGSLFLTGLFT